MIAGIVSTLVMALILIVLARVAYTAGRDAGAESERAHLEREHSDDIRALEQAAEGMWAQGRRAGINDALRAGEMGRRKPKELRPKADQILDTERYLGQIEAARRRTQ